MCAEFGKEVGLRPAQYALAVLRMAVERHNYDNYHDHLTMK